MDARGDGIAYQENPDLMCSELSTSAYPHPCKFAPHHAKSATPANNGRPAAHLPFEAVRYLADFVDLTRATGLPSEPISEHGNVTQMNSEQPNDSKATPRTRSPLIYAIPAALAVVAGVYLVTRPPTGGVFCSMTTGCYEVEFESARDGGTIAFYFPGGARSRRFPLVRESSGVYTAAFIGDERMRFVVQDRDHLVRDDNAIYARTPLDNVQGHLDAALDVGRKERDSAMGKHAAQAEMERKRAEEEAKAQQAKIDNLLSQLASAQDEERRSKLMKQLEEAKPRQTKTGSPARTPPTKPCNCAPNDPLCSCL